jgi:hypothetical protein
MYANSASELISADPRPKARAAISADIVRVAGRHLKYSDSADAHYMVAFAARTAYRISGIEGFRILSSRKAQDGLERAPYFGPLRDLANSVK